MSLDSDDLVDRITVPHCVVVRIYAPDRRTDNYQFYKQVATYTFEGWVPPLPRKWDAVTYIDNALPDSEDKTTWGFCYRVAWEVTYEHLLITIHLAANLPTRVKLKLNREADAILRETILIDQEIARTSTSQHPATAE